MKKSIALPEPVLWLFQRLEQAGYQVYAVGGCVRDALLGKSPQDWDLCTDARPEEMLRLFSDCQTIDAGKKHGTITVILEHQPYEITTFRTEGVYKDGRHPENVQFISDLKEDLRRRDFTMNAMAYHPGEGIVDLYGGISDLKQGMLRCVGDPKKRFSEDALRILRGLRFAACYRYQLEPTAAQAAVKLAPSLRQISAERIAAEFDRFLKGDGKTVAALLRDFTPVWDVILPECRKLRACEQHHPRHCDTVW
ncbi:CCA tRNA nucleotidyltransferase, partial [Ruminococcus sp.]